jgi:HemY protein
MKRSALVLILLALLLAAAALAPLLKSDPGLVRIDFLDWTIETTVLVLAATVVVLWLLASWLVRLWRLPAETARRVQQQRSLKQLEKGLLALTEGDWRTAEKALEKSAGSRSHSTARYLAAAQAAEGQQAGDRREYYLEQADTGQRRKHFLVELTRARMLLNSGARAEALPILESLHARRRRHPQVLELLARCRQELRQWDALQQMLPALRKADVFDEETLEEMQVQIAGGKLRDAVDPDALQAAWKQLPRAMRREPAVVAIYAEQAGAMERADLAEPVLRQALKHQWNSDLVLRYGDPGAANVALRLKQCEKWLLQYPEDANLHLALGRLCVGESLWGKAREHLVRSLELQPSSVGYEILGQLLERQGELEQAMLCFRNALRLNQGKAPLPLPMDQARLASPESA